MIEQNPYNLLKKGALLIASPEISQGLFARSVLLLCEHSPQGSFGLIINKPIEVELPEDIIDLKNSQNPKVQTRAGGPIQQNQMMLLHSCKNLPQTLPLCDDVYLGGDLEFLQSSISNENGPSVLLCFGYAGWGPGLLEKDYMSGIWMASSSTHDYIFKTAPEKLWQKTLLDKGGKYASLSMIPEDLSSN